MRRSMSFVVLGALVLAIVLAPRPAFAGRTFYGWLYGTEVMPERGVELQTWVLERDGLDPNNAHETDLWVGPLVGITDQLELALPVEFEWLEPDPSGGANFTMRRYGAELRYRLVTMDPVEAPAIAPLIRIAAKRDVIVRDATILEADVVASYQKGRLHALIDLGGVATLDGGETGNHFQVRPGAGVSIKVTDELRLGGELYGEIDVDDSITRWLAVGPNMAYTHGRYWMSAAYGIGITGINAAPRVMWGVGF